MSKNCQLCFKNDSIYNIGSKHGGRDEKYSGTRLIGSWLMESFIQGLFGLSTISQAKCELVNGIIWLMESVCLGHKVIPLSGAHFICQQNTH
jgi:hypothetical protein